MHSGLGVGVPAALRHAVDRSQALSLRKRACGQQTISQSVCAFVQVAFSDQALCLCVQSRRVHLARNRDAERLQRTGRLGLGAFKLQLDAAVDGKLPAEGKPISGCRLPALDRLCQICEPGGRAHQQLARSNHLLGVQRAIADPA